MAFTPNGLQNGGCLLSKFEVQWNRIGFEKPQLHRKQTKYLLFLRVRNYSFQATHMVHASNNNFANAILFDCNNELHRILILFL